jgi:hypothetical protein
MPDLRVRIKVRQGEKIVVDDEVLVEKTDDGTGTVEGVEKSIEIEAGGTKEKVSIEFTFDPPLVIP